MYYDQAKRIKSLIEDEYLNPSQLNKRDEYIAGVLPEYRDSFSIEGQLHRLLNGVAMQKKGDEFSLKLYTEGNLPGNALSQLWGVKSTDITTEEIGVISILGTLPVCGDSIGHYKVSAGTLGCYVEDEQGRIHVLSNNHVLANSNKGRQGDLILCPGKKDGGLHPDDGFARLHKYVPIKFRDHNNVVDCALATLSNGSMSKQEIPGHGEIKGTCVATEKMRVYKKGRSTGLSQGVVSSTEATIRVDYGGSLFYKNVAIFTQQIEIKGIEGSRLFSGIGDSGSLLIDNQQNKAVGLIFAGSADGTTFANPIDKVLTSLSANIL